MHLCVRISEPRSVIGFRFQIVLINNWIRPLGAAKTHLYVFWICLNYPYQQHNLADCSIKSHYQYQQLFAYFRQGLHYSPWLWHVPNRCYEWLYRTVRLNPGLFVPLHFRSRERKVHRENFCSRGTFAPHSTFAPWERTFQKLSFPGTFAPVELSFLGSERSKNFHSYETVVPWEWRIFQELSLQ